MILDKNHIYRKTSIKHWNEEAKQFIKNNHKKMSDEELAASLGVTLRSICQERVKLGIKRK